MKEQAILVDTTYCTGCNTCSYKCIQEFGDHELASRGLFRTVVQIQDDGVLRRQCMNCKDPQCVQASSGAFTKSAYGPVLLDVAKLKDGEKVAKSCPFNALHYDEKSGKIVHCNMCAHRLANGKQPACVEACPAGALQSGDYDEMAAKAKQLATSKKLKIYGLNENGGAHVIILTKADPVALGYPNVGKKRLQADMTGITALPLVAGAVYAGLKKYSDRRADVAKSDKGAKAKAK